MSKREPRKCEICGVEFTPRNRTYRTCGKKACQKEHARRENIKEADEKTRKEFSKGRVFVLDMSLPEEEWEFVEENRGG